MESRHVSVADGLSRFLSTLAILVALGSSVYLYQNNQRLKTDLATIKSSSAAPEFKSHAEGWDKKLSDTLTEFESRTNASLKKFDVAREARDRLVGAATELKSGLGKEEVEQIVDDKMGQLTVAASGPELVVARTLMRPTAAGDPPPSMVRNIGSVEAEIRVARFKPKEGSVFAVKNPSKPGDDQVVIDYGPSHNIGADPGFHRFYERSYPLPIQTVPKQTTVQVTVEIRANGEHLDWGMMGDLELEYQDGRTVLIRNTRAIFVADKENTI